MTLLAVAQTLSKDCGFNVPSVVVGSTDRTIVEVLCFANEVGQEIARRADWGKMASDVIVIGTGTSAPITVLATMLKAAEGTAAFTSTGAAIRRLSRSEWPATNSEGVPRFFMLEGNEISFWPYLANGATATVRIQSTGWTSAGTDTFTADTQTTLFPEELLSLGLIAKWRRQKGMAYQDQEAAFEAAMGQHASFDNAGRG